MNHPYEVRIKLALPVDGLSDPGGLLNVEAVIGCANPAQASVILSALQQQLDGVTPQADLGGCVLSITIFQRT